MKKKNQNCHGDITVFSLSVKIIQIKNCLTKSSIRIFVPYVICEIMIVFTKPVAYTSTKQPVLIKKKRKKTNTSWTWLYVHIKCNSSNKNTSNIYNHEKYAVETNVLQLCTCKTLQSIRNRSVHRGLIKWSYL